MNRIELEQFFERLLTEPEGAVEGSPKADARAAFLAILTRSRGAAPGSGDLTAAKLAAYLSGALDPAEVDSFIAELVRAPDEIYELEAAQSFLDRIAKEKSAAPPELVAAVVTEAARELARPAVPARRKWNLSDGGRRWGLAGGAMAAMLLAVVLVWTNKNPVVLGTLLLPPASEPPGTAESRPVEAALPQPAGPRREPVYTAPNPPQAMTSHAVTADDYPADSIRLQEQGAVKLNYFIGTDGNVSDCQLIESSGFPRLDDAACVMVRKWQFKPATVLDGSPVAVWMPVQIVFALKSPAENKPLADGANGAMADSKTRPRAALERLALADPKLEYWHDLLQLAGNEKGVTDEQMLDILRLRLALGDLKTDSDYLDFAQRALIAGYPAEAKAALDKGIAAKMVQNNERVTRLSKKINDDLTANIGIQANLQKKAASDPNSSVQLGLILWSTGKNKEAEDAIRAGITSGKLADPEGAKVALGHALFSQGKKQDAVSAFDSVASNSKEAPIARLWSIYTRSSTPGGPSTSSILPPTERANERAGQISYPPTPPLAVTDHTVTAADYPPVSIRLQEQGTVAIKYTIGTGGVVRECAVTMTSGKPRLDDAACTMAKRRWKFKPATQDGKPVSVSLAEEVVFALKSAESSNESGGAIRLPPRDKTLADAVIGAQADFKAGRFAEALAKAKAADAMPEKPPELTRIIHGMIVSYAISAKDYASALAELDEMAAAGEGNPGEILRQREQLELLLSRREPR